MNKFSQKVLNYLNHKYYVYALIDPTSNKIFYVGKGIDNRIFHHEYEAHKVDETEKVKLLKIKEIESQGHKVKRIILNYNLSKEEAFAGEASVINCLRYMSNDILTNEQSGHHCHSALSVEQVEKIFGAQELPKEYIKDNVLIIKINRLYRPNMTIDEIAEATRGHWRISLAKAKKVDYVFSVYRGLIVGVFKPIEWHDSTVLSNDFPRQHEFEKRNLNHRKYFTCDILDENSDIGKKYLYKNIREFSKNTQNPISYVFNK